MSPLPGAGTGVVAAGSVVTGTAGATAPTELTESFEGGWFSATVAPAVSIGAAGSPSVEDVTVEDVSVENVSAPAGSGEASAGADISVEESGAAETWDVGRDDAEPAESELAVGVGTALAELVDDVTTAELGVIAAVVTAAAFGAAAGSEVQPAIKPSKANVERNPSTTPFVRF